MTQEASQKSRMSILAVNLILLGLCAGGLVTVLGAYYFLRPRLLPDTIPLTLTLRPTSTASLSPTVTLTPSITLTPRPTSTSTITPSPTWSQTPSSTLAQIPFPSLTPALALAYEGAYELADWDAEKADRLVQLIQGYPAGMGTGDIQQNNPAVLQAYTYPIFAVREALLRFPDAPQAEQWRWMLAYNLALNGDPAAGEVYAELIADNLNRAQVSIPELYAWLAIQEPRLDLFMAAVTFPPGYLGSYLLELRGAGGSAFIWLLDKTPAFQAYPLITQFDFAAPRTASWILADLDNQSSNGEEIAIYFSNLDGETYLQPPTVYSLIKTDVQQLPFSPGTDIFQLGMDFDSQWLLKKSSLNKNQLFFTTRIYPSCPIQIEQAYLWNGLYFKSTGTVVEFIDLPVDLAPCIPLIDHAIHHWGPEVAVSLMEALLPGWPPALDLEGDPFPADELDGFRYRLGIYKALTEDFDGAVSVLNSILTDPVVHTSRWIEHARNFLADYQKPDDIYLACKFSPVCDPSVAIQILASSIPSQLDAIRFLREWGVETISSGYFDFEDDDESERWFTVRSSPQQKLDFWILLRNGGTYHPLRIGIVESRTPTISQIDEAYIADEGLGLQPAVLLDGKIPFSIRRIPDTRRPYSTNVPLRAEYPSRFFVPLNAFQEGLLEGSSPEIIQKNLEDLEDFPGLLCKTTWTCDGYYYLLGLASELAGDGDSAVKAYQYLWLNYSKSPFTAMARMKLVPLGTPVVPTFTPTITASATISATQTSGTLTTTPTITGTLTTGTTTPTITVTGTPPTFTPTRSPTSPPAPTATTGDYPPPAPYPTLPYP